MPRRQRFPPHQTHLEGVLNPDTPPPAEGVSAAADSPQAAAGAADGPVAAAGSAPAGGGPGSGGATGGAGGGGGAGTAGAGAGAAVSGGAGAAGSPQPMGPRRTLLRPPPWDKSADVESGGASFGTWLRRQREARQIGLREIAERTKISLRYLEAMEDDRFEVLPAPVFAKGFLREYARYVGLSPDEVVNHWLAVQQKAQAADEAEAAATGRRPQTPHTPYGAAGGTASGTSFGSRQASYGVSSLGGGWPRRMVPRWVVLLGSVVVLLGLVALLAFLSERWRQARAGRGEDRPGIVAPVAAPVPPPPKAAAPPPSVPLEVVVDFNQECWVEAVVDGGSRRAEMREQGESMQLEAKQSVVFTKLGNGAAVDIQVNGYPYPFEKKQGEVLHDLKIDLDTVRALKAKKETAEGH